MGFSTYKPILGDCPVCGKKHGAYMSNSAWAPFHGSVCSDECGEAAQRALQQLFSTDEYQRQVRVVNDAENSLNQMCEDAISGAPETPATGEGK